MTKNEEAIIDLEAEIGAMTMEMLETDDGAKMTRIRETLRFKRRQLSQLRRAGR